MQHEGCRNREDLVDQAVLSILVDDGAQVWSVGDLSRELDDPLTAEAIGRLQRAGLVHRLGDCVLATHAARRARELAW